MTGCWYQFFVGVAIFCLSLLGGSVSAGAAEGELVFGRDLPYAYYRDVGGLLDISEIVKLPPQAFTAALPDKSFSYTDDAIWLRLGIPEPETLNEERFLVILPTTIDSISVFQYQYGVGWQISQTGDRFPYDSRDIRNRSFVFRVSELTDKPLYVRLVSSNSLYLRAALWESRAFFRHDSAETMLWGLYFGLIGSMLLFILINSWGYQRQSYRVLFAAVLLNILHIANMQGFISQIFSQYQQQFGDASPKITGILAMGSSIWLIREFYVRNRSNPFWEKLYSVGGMIGIMVPIGLLVFPFSPLVKFSFYLMLTAIIGAIVLFTWYRQYESSAGRYLGGALVIAFLVYLAVMLGFLGVIPASQLSHSLRHAVFFLLAVSGSFSLLNDRSIHRQFAWAQQQQRLSAVEQLHEDLGQQFQEQQAALLYRESLFSSILNASPDNISITDTDGTITMVNPSGLRLFGYEQLNEVIGRHLLEFIIPEDRERATEDLVEMTLGQFHGPEEYGVMRKNGEIFYIESNAEFIRNPDGEAVSMVLISRDVTERRQIQEELMRAKEAAEQALDRERTVLLEQKLFLSMVTHEFRTPLAVVDSAAVNLMAVPPRSQEQLAERAHQIKRATGALSILIDNCLTMERLEQGGFTPIVQDTVLEELITAASYLVSWSVRHSLVIDLASSPKSWVLDPSLMRIVISNLLDNAIKYSGEGAITVVSRCDGNNLMISVTDGGPGIPAEEQGLIFQKYRRGSKGGVQRSRGSGLGLYTSRMIVEAHGGELRLARSQPGITTFEIILPVG